ncbi:MAG: oligosaccharide flippase family protein [Chitinophagales bacterium]|nr:oligosaccharide flippase family protein [Chitinophagales bacterium]
MKRFFLSNVLLLIFSNLLIKPIWIFGIDRWVQVHCGEHIYGEYFALFNVSILFSVLLDFGIQNFNTTQIAGSPLLFRKYFPNLLLLKVFLLFVYAGITMVFAFLSGYKGKQFEYLTFLVLNQIFLSFILFFRSNITAFQKFKLESVISVLDKLLMIIFLSGFVLLPFLREKFNMRIFILFQTLAYLITLAVAYLSLKGFVPEYAFKINKKWLLVMLRKSIPFSILVFLMTIYYRIDGFLLERIAGAQASGEYAKSYRILDAINNFSFLFSVVLLPIFSKMAQQKKPAVDLLKFSSNLIFWVAIPALSFCAMNAPGILNMLYPMHEGQHAPNSWIFILLIFSSLPISFVYIWGCNVLAKQKIMQLNKIVFAGVFVNLSMNFILIPKMGALGAAITFITTQMLMCLGFGCLTERFFDRLLIIRWICYGFFAILLFSLNYSLEWTFFTQLTLEMFLLISGAAILGIASPQNFRKVYQLIGKKEI